jgi:UDP-N-acetylmuramoyl-tripeptide--D-alanyl-D-alanine ligase
MNQHLNRAKGFATKAGRTAKSFSRKALAAQLERRVQRLIEEQGVKVVAVTGSVGKTSTKLAIASVLRQKYQVLAHQGNFNSEIGLPLSIFEIEVPETLTNPVAWFKILQQIDRILAAKYPYEVLVLEMGADQPGDIKKFMKYITPDIGIVTAIAPVHVEGFGSVATIADEKMALARSSQAVWLNSEDTRVMEESKKLSKPVQTYGIEHGNVHFEGIERSEALTFNGRLQLQNGEIAIKSRMVGKHALSALAIAGAVGEEMGLEPAQIRRGLESFEPVAGRMQVLDGLNGSMIIDDTYNSSPRATVAAVETLLDLPGRKIAILGTMNELGELTESGHREVGRVAARVDELITIGENAGKYLVAGAAEAGLSEAKIHQFDSPYAAGEYVKSILKKGDVVLAKGSQNGVFAEEAVAKILADIKDLSKLVRQSAAWQKTKRQQFDDAG